MSRRIEDFPLSGLQADRAESVADIALCEAALSKGIMTYDDGESVQKRLDTNERIIAVINAELAQRKETLDASPT